MGEIGHMIYFIVNPLAGGGKGAEAKTLLNEVLSAYDGKYEIYETEYPKHAIELAKKRFDLNMTDKEL